MVTLNGPMSANPSRRRSIVPLGFEQVADTLKSQLRQLTDKANRSCSNFHHVSYLRGAEIRRSEREKKSRRARIKITQVVAAMNSRGWKNHPMAAMAW